MTRARSTIARSCVALLLATLPALPSHSQPASSAAAPDQTRQIRQFMNECATKFASGDWDGARLAYLEAWLIKQHPAVAANMAAAEMKLGRYREAAEHLKYSLKHVPLVQTDKRDAVEGQLNECLAHLAPLTIKTNVGGAVVTVDTLRVGRSPLPDAVLVDPGTHKLQAFAEGYAAYTQEFSVKAGQALSVSVELQPNTKEELVVPVAESSSPPTSTLDSGSSNSHVRTWTIVGGSVATAVALGIGVAFRLKSNSDENGAKSLQTQLASGTSANLAPCSGPRRPALCDSLSEKLAAFDRDRDLSTGAFIASGILGTATLVTALVWPTHGTKPPQASHTVRLAPFSVGMTPGMRLSVEF